MSLPEPKQPIRNRRDFFIHIGTTAAGLALALAFQAGAEWWRDMHQRHLLESDLHGEAIKNREMAANDIQLYDQTIVWLLQLQSQVNAQAVGSKATITVPPRPDGLPDSVKATAYRLPATAVWTTAKESASLKLLPRGEGEVFSRVYLQIDLVNETRLNFREAAIRQTSFETRFAHGIYPPQPDFTKLKPADVDEYAVILADELERARIAEARLKVFNVANEFVLRGNGSDDDLRKAFLETNPSANDANAPGSSK